MSANWLTHTLTLAACALALGCGSNSADPKPAPGSGGSAGIAEHSAGAPAPGWQLEDFQPKSAKLGQIYGLDAFQGSVTVAALLAGW